MRKIVALAGAALALGAFSAGAQAQPWGSSDPQAVCHATGSASNPYVLINPSARGAARGHAGDAQGGPSTRRAATSHHLGACSGDGGGGGGGGGGVFAF